MSLHKSRILFSLPLLLISAGSFSQEISHLYTYIDSTVVEQREVYTSEEIREAHSESLTGFLENAGLQLLSYGPYGLESKPSIRGFTDETVRVIIDGICVNNAQYGTFDFTSINLENIERIEIVRGGFTEGISDEGAVGGAIYITTKKQSLGHKFFSDTSAKTFFNSASLIDTISQSLGYSGQIAENDFLKLNGKFTSAQNKFQFTDFNNRLTTRKNAEVTDGSGDLTYSHFFENGSSATITESFYGGNKNCPGTRIGSGKGNQKDYDNRLSVNFQNPIYDFLKIENNAAWLSNTRYYEDKSGKSEHFVNTFTYAVYADYFRYKFFQQSAGFTFDYVHLDSTNDGLHNQFSGTFKETTKLRFNSIFSMSLPLAVKFSGKNFELIPKLGLRADTKFIDILLDGYRMIQFPNMDDLYWEAGGFHGNPDLKAENGWGADFTINVHDVLIPFSLCTYTNFYENKIQWSTKSGEWQPENISSAFYLGFNFTAQKSLFNDHLSFRGSAEYLYTELLDETNKATYKKRIMWTPDLVWSYSIKLKFSRICCIFEQNYTGKRYTSNSNLSSLDPYTISNFATEYTTWKHMTAYVRGENIFDVKYEAVENYPMPGASLTLGVRFF